MFGHLNLVGDCPEFEIFRCSLCRALGRGYGPMARFFTNYDLALTMLAAISVTDERSAVRKRLCPAFAHKNVITGHGELQDFLAAVTIVLTAEKVRDDEYDEGVTPTRWARRWLERKRAKAEAGLRDMGFVPDLLREAFTRQRLLEREQSGDLLTYAASTAEVMAEVYAHAAKLSGEQSSTENFRAIGHALGEIIYILDSIVDYREDLRRNAFNPLRFCGRTDPLPVHIPSETLAQLSRLLADCQARINTALSRMDVSSLLHDTLTHALDAHLRQVLNATSEPEDTLYPSFFARLRDVSPLTLLFYPRLAFASNGQGGLASCLEPLIPFAIMLFALNCVMGKLCGRGLCGQRGPDKITVDDGCCGGKKTYRRDPFSGRYREDGCC